MNLSEEITHCLRDAERKHDEYERLAAQILLVEGFTNVDPSHPGGGPDGGKDAICNKAGQKWVMAAYFPFKQLRMAAIRKKFKKDFAGVEKNNAHGFAFVTNQKISLSERSELEKLCGTVQLELFHLDRLIMILMQDSMDSVRIKFGLRIQKGYLLLADWSAMHSGKVDEGELIVGGNNYPLLDHSFSDPSPNFGSLLSWNSRIPERIVGRDIAMEDLQKWAEKSGQLRIRILWGSAGVGKTRLAVELGDTLRKRGWNSYLINSCTPNAFVPSAKGTLLIVDYPEYYPANLENFLLYLKKQIVPKGTLAGFTALSQREYHPSSGSGGTKYM